MFGINRWRSVARTLLISGLLVCVLNLWGCGGNSRSEAPKTRSVAARSTSKAAPVKLSGKISEVSPPEVIQELRDVLERYQPQVTIVSPRSNEVLQDDTVSVRLQVKDLPLYKDEKLGLGTHLHLFLDNQPYQAVYDVSQPIALKDLSPGTHTIRTFASRPWHESFKNEGSYAQTTFHVFTKTPDNNPNPELPLLTYSRPQAAYGAEPIMLDFFLTNAPLHIVAQDDEQDDVADWRIKVTVNGSEFVLDRWQPLYLKGFTPGKNWVQLEYIDEKGNPVQNVYNNTARSFTYTPKGTDTLSKLVRDELSFAQARSIVDPNYKAETPDEPSPQPSPMPTVAPVPVVHSIPPVMQPVPEMKEPAIVKPSPKIEPSESPKPEETKPLEEPKGGFFNRLRRPAEPEPTPSVTPEPSPSVAPALVEPIEEPAPKLEDEKPSEVSKVKEAPKEGFFNRFRRPESPKPSPVTTPEPTLSIPSELAEPTKEPAPEAPETQETAPEIPETQEPDVEISKPKSQPKFYDRFRRPSDSLKVTPEPSPSVSPVPIEEPKEVEPDLTEKAPEVTAPKVEPKPKFYDRFRRPVTTPKPSPIEVPAPTNEVKEPTPEPAETKPSESANPLLKTELERRLGIPLSSPKPTLSIEPSPQAVEVKPPAPVDAAEIKPVEPQQPRSFQPRKSPNQFRRPSSPIESPEAPIKLPETLEAPPGDPTPIQAVQ